MIRPTLLAVLLLAASPAAAGDHPRTPVGADEGACLSCHATATPGAVKEWARGAHGPMLVTCFVCHGTTGKDFAARPASGERCERCHAAQAASVAHGDVGGCFRCHAGHTLAAREPRGSPHTAVVASGPEPRR
jgi:hypothetical protein